LDHLNCFELWVSCFEFSFYVRKELSHYFIVLIFVAIVIHIVLDFLGGNPVALLHPGAEVDQSAAIGTKRPVRVIVPGRFFVAIWALYCARHGILNQLSSVLSAKRSLTASFFSINP